jgi:hypothetical protein
MVFVKGGNSRELHEIMQVSVSIRRKLKSRVVFIHSISGLIRRILNDFYHMYNSQCWLREKVG